MIFKSYVKCNATVNYFKTYIFSTFSESQTCFKNIWNVETIYFFCISISAAERYNNQLTFSHILRNWQQYFVVEDKEKKEQC